MKLLWIVHHLLFLTVNQNATTEHASPLCVALWHDGIGEGGLLCAITFKHALRGALLTT